MTATDKNTSRDRTLVEEAELLALADAQAFDAATDALDNRGDWRADILLDDPDMFEWEPEPEALAPRKYAAIEPTNFRAGIRAKRARQLLDAELLAEEARDRAVAEWLDRGAA